MASMRRMTVYLAWGVYVGGLGRDARSDWSLLDDFSPFFLCSNAMIHSSSTPAMKEMAQKWKRKM